jgi:hypothetical protein
MGSGVSSSSTMRLRKAIVIRAYNLRKSDVTLDEQFRPYARRDHLNKLTITLENVKKCLELDDGALWTSVKELFQHCMGVTVRSLLGNDNLLLHKRLLFTDASLSVEMRCNALMHLISLRLLRITETHLLLILSHSHTHKHTLFLLPYLSHTTSHSHALLPFLLLLLLHCTLSPPLFSPLVSLKYKLFSSSPLSSSSPPNLGPNGRDGLQGVQRLLRRRKDSKYRLQQNDWNDNCLCCVKFVYVIYLYNVFVYFDCL